MRFPASVVGAFLVVAISGCNYSEIAKADFSDARSCPADRITMTKIEWGDRLPPPATTPPSDVAADPARLAMWNQTHGQTDDAARDERMSGIRDSMADHSFRADGCGATAYYSCGQCRGSGCRQESTCHATERKVLEASVQRRMITP